ncbi:uncharacterized protein MEPE_06721 [Melanopsichium pennsylvanicum]|uniref:Synembryn-A n=1 Tax=Melanopsichium pennsylvanicum TaxID=63383 RepID=A0AAJ4XSC6_9BASI|nr:uncharacterized protein MEPE_06721 [Melanopsichium pennsylvanicum]
MSDVIREYLSLPSSVRVSSPNQVQQWLDALLSGGLNLLGSVTDSIRTKLSVALLNDIAAASGTRDGDYLLNARSSVGWNSATRFSALKLLKELSRLPGGSAPLGDPEALRVLLQQVDFPKQRVRRSSIATSKLSASTPSTPTPSTPTPSNGAPSTLSVSTYSLVSIAKTLRRAVSKRASHQSDRCTKDRDVPSSESSSDEYDVSGDPDWLITDMALRCLNNALYLNQDARLPFSSQDIGGGHVAVALLSRPYDTPADILFLAARLLFFSTLFESPFNKIAVTTLNAVNIEAACVDALVKASLEKGSNPNAASSVLVASGSKAQVDTALSDLLKAHFNICLYYPRIIDAETKQQQQQQQKQQSEMNGPTRKSEPQQPPILGEAFHSELLPMLSPLMSVITALPLPHPVPLMPPFTHAISALLNYPVAHVKTEIDKSRPTSSSSSSWPKMTTEISACSTHALGTAPLYISRLMTLVDLTLCRYFGIAPTADDDGRKIPEDVDSKIVKAKANTDGIEIEDSLEPLLLLLGKIASEDEQLRTILRNIVLPTDLDRSVALDRRIDVLGRLVRLMSSVTLVRSARASGEVLLALCDGEAKVMSEKIGYGPCAGFLMNTGLACALPSGVKGSEGSNGRVVDPITGVYEATEEEKAMDEINTMTEEEKEAEAEKLFVLFDRLNKTGVVQVRHPMATAKDEGRFEEVDENVDKEERERIEKEDEEVESQVEREMAAYKKRKEESSIRAQKFMSQPSLHNHKSST